MKCVEFFYFSVHLISNLQAVMLGLTFDREFKKSKLLIEERVSREILRFLMCCGKIGDLGIVSNGMFEILMGIIKLIKWVFRRDFSAECFVIITDTTKDWLK